MKSLLGFVWFRNYVLKQARAKVLKQTAGNYPAPLAMLDVRSTTTPLPLSRSFDSNRRLLGTNSQHQFSAVNESK